MGGHGAYRWKLSDAGDKAMTTRKTKQPAVGDRGQRYEIWCDDEDGKPMQMGWSNNPESMKQAVEKHPCWSNHRAVDRLGAAAADNGARESHAGPRSSAAPGSGALTWSAETPKRRGWWWFRAGPGCEAKVLEVAPNMDGELIAPGATFGMMKSMWPEMRWAGPLVEPVEASDAEPLPNKQICD